MNNKTTSNRVTDRLRQQAAALDKQCESNKDAIAGLADLLTLLKDDYAQRIRQIDAQIADFQKRTQAAKADAAELRRIADQVDKQKPKSE